MYHRPQRPPPRPFPGRQQPRAESATNLFTRVVQTSNAQQAEHFAQQSLQFNPHPGSWRAYDPSPNPPPTTSPGGTPMHRFGSLMSSGELVPPSFSPYSQPSPAPTPTQRLANLIAWSSGSTSQIFKAVVKRPQLVQLYMNDELHTNAPDVENQFLAELRAYQTSGPHKHIASLLGCLEGIGMVLEQVDGDTLFERVLKRNGRWENETLLRVERVNLKLKIEWFNQMVEALVHVHQHGLSHGDINSLNVLITHPTSHPPNIIKLIDFGRSTFYCPPNAPPDFPPSEIPHPPAHPFAAPEILRGGKYIAGAKRLPVDGRLADAYSLGVLLWCLDEEKLVEIDQMVQRKEEVVLFNNKDGDDADDEDSPASTPSPPVVDEGYFSGNNENPEGALVPELPTSKNFTLVTPSESSTILSKKRHRLFASLISGYMRRWEERTKIELSQRLPVPETEDGMFRTTFHEFASS